MGASRTAAFHTLGCKLNFAETSTLARQLADAGYARVPFEARPDVFVLNTCSVTENADRECRQWVRRSNRENPEGVVVVVGCYAQLKPREIAAIPGVDLVLGAGEKFDLPAHLDRLHGKRSTGLAVAGPVKEVRDFVPSWNRNDRTRTFLKVQDGCDYFCSFCTIPLARGRSRSGTVAETVRLAQGIAASGVKEIVLTGVNTGDFGRAHGETFLDLVRALDRVDGIERFRISSIEPNLLTDGVIDLVAESARFMPHFHVPLQSGSDAVLQRMRRRYDTRLYAERLERIARTLPHACLGADVITGTPGEDEQEFRKTDAFLRSLPLNYLHVFTYSERAHTTAVRMDEAVPMEIRRQRTKVLRALGDTMLHDFLLQNAGSERDVLFEHEGPDGTMLGYTDNYVRVHAAHDPHLAGTIVPTVLGAPDGTGRVPGTPVLAHEPIAVD